MCRKRFILLSAGSKASITVSSNDQDFVIAADASTGGQVVQTFKDAELVGKTVSMALALPGPHELFIEAAFTGAEEASVDLEVTVEDQHGARIRPAWKCTLSGRRLSATKPRVREAEIDFFMRNDQVGGGS
jgi:hypothetical protein